MKRLSSIQIKYVKGIEDRIFQLELVPNKPALLIAPNGFGKSSFSIALSSLNNARIKLHKNNFYLGNETNKPQVSLKYVDAQNIENLLHATDSTNDISSVFDTFVINSRLEPKSTQRKFNNTTAVVSSLVVSPIVLIDNIPDQCSLSYSPTQAKDAFGGNGKILPNIARDLSNAKLLCEFAKEVDFSKFLQSRIRTVIDIFVQEVNSLPGSSKLILEDISSNKLAGLSAIKPLSDMVVILKRMGEPRLVEAQYFLAAIQLSSVISQDIPLFKKTIKSCECELEQDFFNENLNVLNSTWKNIKPKKIKNKLSLEFPAAHNISNGERDILCFVALLLRAKYKLKKKYCILVIDELFDYLDDANLISAQYYLSQFIKEFRDSGRLLFPIILTHLNPLYFKSYCFKKPTVVFLERKHTQTSKIVHNVIVKRSDETIKDSLGKYFLHFHPDNEDLKDQFEELSLDERLCTSKKFHAHVEAELDRYLAGHSFDPIAVCCGIRIILERKVFARLDSANGDEFLKTRKTVEKFDFAESIGINIPEVYYLLGVLYNEALHIRQEHDNFTPLFSKLNNKTVRNMIEQAVRASTV